MLDSHLDEVHCHVLGTIPLPNLQTIYDMVCDKVNGQEVMLEKTTNEMAALVARESYARECTLCNGDNRMVDTCFKID